MMVHEACGTMTPIRARGVRPQVALRSIGATRRSKACAVIGRSTVMRPASHERRRSIE
jgi:hypothetical protein